MTTPEAAAHARDHAAVCECPPCPGRGTDGHRMAHCAECCFGTGVEADPTCPVHGDHAALRERAEVAEAKALDAVLVRADEGIEFGPQNYLLLVRIVAEVRAALADRPAGGEALTRAPGIGTEPYRGKG